MLRWLLIPVAGASSVVAAIFLLLPPASPAVNTTLLADVGPEGTFGISLKNADGTNVTRLDPGTYEIHVNDHSADSSFHLTGPGVDKATGIVETVTVTWTVTFTDGVYHFQCDAMPAFMFGNFTVGPPPPPPPPPPIHGDRCVIPKVLGLRLVAAKRKIRQRHCGVGRVSRSHSRRVGVVVGQSPKPGTVRHLGFPVRLVVGRR